MTEQKHLVWIMACSKHLSSSVIIPLSVLLGMTFWFGIFNGHVLIPRGEIHQQSASQTGMHVNREGWVALSWG